MDTFSEITTLFLTEGGVDLPIFSTVEKKHSSEEQIPVNEEHQGRNATLQSYCVVA
jgi:hypothetical protein